MKEDFDLWFVNDDLNTVSTGQSTHHDSVKKNCRQCIFFLKFCLRRTFPPKNLVCLAFFGKKNLLNYLISVSSSVCRLIGIEFDSNSNTQWSQRHNLQRRQWRKCQLSNPLSGETSWDTNRTTPIQFQISFTNQHTSSYVTKSSQPLNCLYSSPFPRRFFAPPPEPLAQ